MLRATTPADLDDARRLFRAFHAWHQGREGAEHDRLAAYFDAAAYEREIVGLPGEYAEPDGALLLARLDGVAVGCVASKRIGVGACEMKRMYVDGGGRGHGIGRALAVGLVARARGAGYTEMLLDTSRAQVEAIGLYRSLGFEEVPPYHDVPPEIRDWLVYFRLAL